MKTKYISDELCNAVNDDTNAFEFFSKKFERRESSEMILVHHDIDVLTQALNELTTESLVEDIFMARQRLISVYGSLSAKQRIVGVD